MRQLGQVRLMRIWHFDIRGAPEPSQGLLSSAQNSIYHKHLFISICYKISTFLKFQRIYYLTHCIPCCIQKSAIVTNRNNLLRVHSSKRFIPVNLLSFTITAVAGCEGSCMQSSIFMCSYRELWQEKSIFNYIRPHNNPLDICERHEYRDMENM